MSRLLRFKALLLTLSVLAFVTHGWSQANGIYADFTTSMGSFTCKLEYAIAPKACANFIGLATGQRAWLDLPSGRAKTNSFYNGIIFHRVIPNFVIQAGSPNQQGTDGPGYVFTDEFNPSFQFNAVGVLAMANSGTNSNGSQFFITTTNNPGLPPNTYTIFGELAGGTNVVLAIGGVATGANNKPLTNVVIQSVNIRRVGTAALAFDVNTNGVPIVTNLSLKLTNGPTQVGVLFTNKLYAENHLYSSTNLSNWTAESLGFETATMPLTNFVTRTKDTSRKFYSMAQVQYQTSPFVPKVAFGKQVVLSFSGGDRITNNFDAVGTGTYVYVPASGPTATGTITQYSWSQDLSHLYQGYLWPIYFSGLVPMTMQMNFLSETNGGFNGTAYPASGPSFAIAGTFTLK
jgi:peptidyl-prolyl cis-trans isomerase A (cyclophilin A)